LGSGGRQSTFPIRAFLLSLPFFRRACALCSRVSFRAALPEKGRTKPADTHALPSRPKDINIRLDSPMNRI
jgi:hypothetical protein